MVKLQIQQLKTQILLLFTLLLLSSESLSAGLANSQDIYNKNSELHTKVAISFSTEQLTPGQQLTLTIAITYLEGVEVFFNIKQIDWQDFSLLNYQKSAPTWLASHGGSNEQRGQWQKEYVIDLAVPLAGEYKLPEMIVHSYLQQQHHSQVIQAAKVIVTSSFPTVQDMKLQPIEVVTQLAGENNNAVNHKDTLLLSIVMLSLFVIILLLFPQKYHRNKDSKHRQDAADNKTALSPEQLLLKLNENAEYHWDELRQCMLVHLGFDPLDEAINSQYLVLSQRYRSARFSTDNKASYIALCQLCQSTSHKRSKPKNSSDEESHSGSQNV